MKITCPACSAEYNVDPTRIPATGLNMRCPKCSQSFSVTADGQTHTDEAVGNTMLDGGGHSIKGDRFYVKRATGKVFGPFDRNAVQLMLKTGKLGSDAEVSTDKQSWQSILEIPAFSQFVSDKPLPDFGDVENPKATMMGGWQQQAAPVGDLPAAKSADLPAARSAGDLPAAKRPAAPDLPSPKRPGGPPELPALKASTSSAGLPVPKNGGPELPVPRGSELPVPRGAGLPTPKSELPAPKGDLPVARGSDLPSPARDSAALPSAARDSAALPVSSRESGALPVNARDSAALPVPRGSDDDLFGGGALDEGSDLFGGGGDDDDLFGAPLGGDDDLFGGGSAKGADDDLFGPPSGKPAGDDDDLFGGPAGRDEDLFGGPSGGVDDGDLFGTPSEAHDDDLFAKPASGSKDDFLGGDAGFSFLDDAPKPADDWGDDLFNASSAVSEAQAASAPAEDWGDELLDLDARPAKPKSTAPLLDADDPFRPASTGIAPKETAQESAKVSKDKAVDADKKRGLSTMIAVPVLAVALIGVGAFVVMNFLGDDTVTTTTTKTETTAGVGADLVKADTYAAYAPLTDPKTKAASGEEGKHLFVQSMMLARYPNETVANQAKATAASLDKAKGGWEALGRGAYEAQAGNADAARAYLEPVASEGGDLAFFANLAMGVGDTKAVEAEASRRASQKPEKRAPIKPMVVPNEEPAETNNAVAGTNNGTTGTTGTNGAAADAAPPEPPKVTATPEKPDYGGLVERGYAALDAAAKLDPQSPVPHYWKGRLARTAHDGEVASTALKKAAELGPKHVASLVELGELEYEKGNLNEAIELLERVSGELSSTASNGEKASALHYAGMVHVARRQTDLAIEAFTKALSIDSSRSDTLRALAEEYERAHKYKEALNFFTTNKNLGKQDPEVMLGIVRSHIGLEQWPQAVATLEEGQRLFPEDPQFPYYLGQLYMKRYAFADARKPLERAVEIDPSLLTAHATLAQLAWLQDKDIPKAEEHIQTIVSYPQLIDAAVATQVAEYYHISDNRPVAEQWYREALERDPNHWPARLALSKLLLEEGREDEAKGLLERARKEGVQDVRLSAYLADAYRQAGDFDRAIDEINKVIEAFPKSEEYVFIRGRIHFDRGNYDTAREDFSRAYDLNPRYHDAYFYVGQTAFKEGDYENALKIFRHVLDYKPDRGDYRFMMARTLESLRRESQALDEYRKATAVDPAYGIENPMVYVHRGRLLSKLGYSKEGKEDIARALELAPDNVEALFAAGESDFREKAYESAIVNYKRALERTPERAEAQAKLGMAYLYTDRRSEAAQRLQLAIKYGHEDPEIYKRLGYLYRDLGQRSQAVEAFKKFLQAAEKKGNVPPATKREVLDQIKMLQ